MLILRSKIINANIINLQDQSKVGVVGDLILKKDNPAVAGIILKNRLSKTLRVICSEEIIEIVNNAVIINNDNAICDLKDNLRLKEMIEKGFCGSGQLIMTKSGKKLGRAFDYLVNSTDFNITKYYIKSLFGERIIAANLIVEITAKKIMIKDDYELSKSALPAIETSII